jgi:predicted DNA binding CopG/RHH family protein
MTPKEKQRELIVEIMKADEQSGLYDEPSRKNTAVDWLVEQLDEQVFRIDHVERRINISISFEDMMTIKREAREMEEGQIAVAYSTGTLDGVNQNFTNGYSYYEKTYKSK